MTTHTVNSREEADFLARLEFKNQDVLSSAGERMRRKANLLEALAMESINQSEVLITVEDLRCCRKIRSRILAAGNDRVVLERGISLPLHCIHRLEIMSLPESARTAPGMTRN
jgi:hypothetical protein